MYRYKNQFTYAFDVDPDCLGYYCNKITLQPIIENAITHGLDLMVEEGRIDVRVRSDGEDIVFSVQDLSLIHIYISAYIRYCFRLRSGSLELWYGPNGFRDTEPGMDEDFFEFLWPNPEDGFKAPDWSSGQVYYQLFPERFKNGEMCIRDRS